MAGLLRDLLGRPLTDLRVSVTDRCNLRCTYCMPEGLLESRSLPREALLTFEEIARCVRLATRLGVRRVRITGGEPLVRKGVVDLVEMLRALPGIDDLSMTTNGLLFTSHAAALAAAGLDRVTLSLDSLDGEELRRINGSNAGAGPVLEAVEEARRVGLEPVKINVVVQRGINDGSIEGLAAFFRGTGFVIRFIEFMDVGTCNGWELEKVVPGREIVERINRLFELEPVDRRHAGEVATRYRYTDGGGEIGIITSVSSPFCSDCSRLRLAADGKLYPCLFASNGVDLKAELRSGATDDELLESVTGLWSARSDRYSELRSSVKTAGQPARAEMYQIGG